MLTAISLVVAAALTQGQPAQPAPEAENHPAVVEVPMPPSRVKNPEFLEQFAATYRFQHGRPRNITVTPAGDGVLFLRSASPRSFVQDLWLYDIASGQERVLLTADQVLGGGKENLTPEELARRERMRLSSRGIVSYELSEDGTRLIVPLSGRIFQVDLATKGGPQVKELKGGAGYPLDPRLSRDGTKLACVRDGDLYVFDLPTGVEQRLTTRPEGKAGVTITHGLAEFAAQEEMDRFQGYWFSPDAKWIAYQRTDTAGLETFHIADPVNPNAEPNVWPYPRAGKANAKVELGVMPVAGGPTMWVKWDNQKYPYLAKVTWAKNAPLTMLVLNREQTELLLLAVDPATGETTTLVKETDPKWINLEPGIPRWLEDGSGFLWMTEQADNTTGWRLERRARDGSLVAALTGEEEFGHGGLEGLVDVDQKSGTVLVTGGPDPTQTHVYRVPLAAMGKPERITSPEQRGDHGATVGKDHRTWVHTYARLDGAIGWDVYKGTEKVGSLKSIAEQPPFMPKPEMVRVGKKLVYDAVIIRPRDFDPAKKYPVIESVYGGPHSTMVRSSAWNYMLPQWLADQGFVVVSVDARGTPRRGRAWERAIKGDVMSAPLADHVAALTLLGKQYPEMDLSRVGVTGWSFGGYFSAMAAMRRPEMYKAGVAGAPVADWLDYDTCYTERYMGVPGTSEVDEAYAKASVLTYCKDLRVPLLIIHGTADDNVYFMHSLKMTGALFRAGRPFEFLPLAGFTHSVPDPEVTRRLHTRVAEFFLEKLGEPGPR